MRGCTWGPCALSPSVLKICPCGASAVIKNPILQKEKTRLPPGNSRTLIQTQIQNLCSNHLGNMPSKFRRKICMLSSPPGLDSIRLDSLSGAFLLWQQNVNSTRAELFLLFFSFSLPCPRAGQRTGTEWARTHSLLNEQLITFCWASRIYCKILESYKLFYLPSTLILGRLHNLSEPGKWAK